LAFIQDYAAQKDGVKKVSVASGGRMRIESGVELKIGKIILMLRRKGIVRNSRKKVNRRMSWLDKSSIREVVWLMICALRRMNR
jgi:hypothetical protein